MPQSWPVIEEYLGLSPVENRLLVPTPTVRVRHHRARITGSVTLFDTFLQSSKNRSAVKMFPYVSANVLLNLWANYSRDTEMKQRPETRVTQRPEWHRDQSGTETRDLMLAAARRHCYPVCSAKNHHLHWCVLFLAGPAAGLSVGGPSGPAAFHSPLESAPGRPADLYLYFLRRQSNTSPASAAQGKTPARGASFSGDSQNTAVRPVCAVLRISQSIPIRAE